jgi:hypothetical protein
LSSFTPNVATDFGSSARGWLHPQKEDDMSPKPQTGNGDDLLPEYDLSNAVRGKYYDRYQQGTNVVLLDPDVAAVFPDARAVNDALRFLVAVADAKASRPKTGRPKPLEPTIRARRKAKSNHPARPARG